MNKYAKIKRTLNMKYQGKHNELANSLLNAGYDSLFLKASNNEPFSREDLRKFLWQFSKDNYEELKLNPIIYYFVLRFIINWIVDQIFEGR